MYDIVNLFDLNKFKQKISFLLSIFNLMQMTRGMNFHSDIRCTRQAHVPHFWQLPSRERLFLPEKYSGGEIC